MTRIAQIQPFIQDYVEAIAQVLEVEVEIVDEEYMRIGGTGLYSSMIGDPVPRDSQQKAKIMNGRTSRDGQKGSGGMPGMQILPMLL